MKCVTPIDESLKSNEPRGARGEVETKVLKVCVNPGEKVAPKSGPKKCAEV